MVRFLAPAALPHLQMNLMSYRFTPMHLTQFRRGENDLSGDRTLWAAGGCDCPDLWGDLWSAQMRCTVGSSY